MGTLSFSAAHVFVDGKFIEVHQLTLFWRKFSLFGWKLYNVKWVWANEMHFWMFSSHKQEHGHNFQGRLSHQELLTLFHSFGAIVSCTKWFAYKRSGGILGTFPIFDYTPLSWWDLTNFFLGNTLWGTLEAQWMTWQKSHLWLLFRLLFCTLPLELHFPENSR